LETPEWLEAGCILAIARLALKAKAKRVAITIAIFFFMIYSLHSCLLKYQSATAVPIGHGPEARGSGAFIEFLLPFFD
jgi:hypothetical protein